MQTLINTFLFPDKNSSEMSESDVNLRFKKRRSFIRKSCSSHQMPSPTPRQQLSFPRYIIVDDKHKFLYCLVPKSGCTSWRLVLLVLLGKVKSFNEVHDPHDMSQFTFLSSFSEKEEIDRRLKTYKKFMTYRDPLTRLVSAYYDKFVTPGRVYQMRYGRKIIAKYRPGASNESLSTGSDVTFKEFVQFVLDGVEKKRPWMDPHWMPASLFCQPCSNDYDYYSLIETLGEDSVAVLSALGAPQSLRLPHGNVGHKSLSNEQLYSQLPRIYVEKLLKLYETDYSLFGHDIPDVKNIRSIN